MIRSELTMIGRQPLQAHLDVADTVPGIGYVSDMTFAVTPEDPLARQSDVSVVQSHSGVDLTSVGLACSAGG